MFTLLLIVLLSNGHTYDMGSREFETKDRCEGYRESLIIQAQKQADTWLISSCESANDPVTLKVFFKDTPEAPGDKT